jgi:hypothetical protein
VHTNICLSIYFFIRFLQRDVGDMSMLIVFPLNYLIRLYKFFTA